VDFAPTPWGQLVGFGVLLAIAIIIAIVGVILWRAFRPDR
jgi:hypothetical protein